MKKRILRVSSYVERNTHTLLEHFKKNLLRRLHQENTLYIKYMSMMSTTENNTLLSKESSSVRDCSKSKMWGIQSENKYNYSTTNINNN
ncbi:hypothetical protein RIR_jg37672.t1 [Rhizophagus irregularis DAOM 181602=DAOM 197198]|nr:hypothetical protein RIR_jg37672.t1 [Rhizophagus irregularis DAOM 181602=DAOM 197198]